MVVTSGGEPLQIPKTTVHGTASWVPEGVASSSADEDFGQVTLGSFTARRLVKVSLELVEDNAVDLVEYLAKEIGRSIGALENAGYIDGSGAGEPTGLLGQASLGKLGPAGQTNEITADDLIDLFYSVGPQYRHQAEWVMADSTVKAVRKLRDSNGDFLWAANPGVGGALPWAAPDTLLGLPIWNDPDMPAMAADAKSVLFGDLSAYMIRDVGAAGPQASERPIGAFSVIRLNERFMDGLQVGFLGYHRTDGNLIDQTGAVRYFQHGGS